MMLNENSVLSLLPDRPEDAHKGNFGKLLLLCGSRGFTGAAYLSAMGALRSGAGLVFLGVPESIYAIEAIKLNEAVVFPLPDRDGALSRESIGEIQRRLPQMDAMLLGCGLGLTADTEALVCWALKNVSCPLILDADGITLAAQHKDLLRGRTGITILTPHEGEFARLGYPARERQDTAAAAARELGCILVLKGHGRHPHLHKSHRQSRHGSRRQRRRAGGHHHCTGWAGTCPAGSICLRLLAPRQNR